MIDGVIAYQHGIFPRSEDVVAATRGLERGRVAQQAVDARFEADLDLFVQTQREARLDYFSDGMLRWQDVFRTFGSPPSRRRSASQSRALPASPRHTCSPVPPTRRATGTPSCARSRSTYS